VSNPTSRPVERVENTAPDGNLTPLYSYPGAPLVPRPGVNPLSAGIGPGAWADRAHRLDLTVDGEPKIRPLRRAPGFSLHPRDPNPIGMAVVGLDGVEARVVVEGWVDVSELLLRYLEVRVHANDRLVLVPIPFTKVDARRGIIRVGAIASQHFADVPETDDPDTISLLEEDKISAYFAAGFLYATPDRLGPIL